MSKKKAMLRVIFFLREEELTFPKVKSQLNSIFIFYLSNLRNFDIQNDIILYMFYIFKISAEN